MSLSRNFLIGLNKYIITKNDFVDTKKVTANKLYNALTSSCQYNVPFRDFCEMLKKGSIPADKFHNFSGRGTADQFYNAVVVTPGGAAEQWIPDEDPPVSPKVDTEPPKSTPTDTTPTNNNPKSDYPVQTPGQNDIGPVLTMAPDGSPAGGGGGSEDKTMTGNCILWIAFGGAAGVVAVLLFRKYA